MKLTKNSYHAEIDWISNFDFNQYANDITTAHRFSSLATLSFSHEARTRRWMPPRMQTLCVAFLPTRAQCRSYAPATMLPYPSCQSTLRVYHAEQFQHHHGNVAALCHGCHLVIAFASSPVGGVFGLWMRFACTVAHCKRYRCVCSLRL